MHDGELSDTYLGRAYSIFLWLSPHLYFASPVTLAARIRPWPLRVVAALFAPALYQLRCQLR